MPAVDPPEAVQPYEYLSSGGEQVFRFWENVERRPVRLAGEPYDASVIRAWTRFRPVACFEDPFLDASRALILLDTYGFPAAYQRYRSWEYLALNLDTMGVSGRVWDVHGALLASGAAQLCCIPNHNGEA